MISLPQMPSMSLSGKTAVITGASSGIGQGAATALAQVGAKVICVARGKERLEETVSAIQAQGWKAVGKVLDVNDRTAMEQIFAENSIDVVVNSAGLARNFPAINTSEQDYDEVMQVNVKSAYFLSTIAAKSMMDNQKAGSIIHISSQMGHVGGVDRSVYCASKHAIEGMVKSMAIEWGSQGIRINTICPTFIRTPLTESSFQNPERLQWIQEKIKLNRVGLVSDVMGAVFYLATDLSSLVTGSSILVDGGWTAG